MHDNQNQTHWAYIAGVMDSDGCFMITKHKRMTKNRTTDRAFAFPKNLESWSYTYMPTVKISQIEPEAILFITNDMKYGAYNIDGARASRPNSKDIYHWRITNKEKLVPFLKGVIPFLRIKKKRAEFLLDYCLNQIAKPNPCYRGLNKLELNYREQAHQKMREFNGNKVGATTNPLGRESVSDSLNS